MEADEVETEAEPAVDEPARDAAATDEVEIATETDAAQPAEPGTETTPKESK